MNIFLNLIERLREPSSWGGIAVLLTVFGLSQDQAGAVTELLTAAAATASIFMHEKGRR
ncbi:MAG: hypothetical protein HQL07_03965 [Nitrospirae bacterium]|nr:hypothetical protein [Magnetococcales bacterium]